MKKVSLFLVFGLFVLASAFSQRVGDIVQVSGQTFRVTEYSGGRLVMQLVSLDGLWQSGTNGGIQRISGRSGVFAQIDPSREWQNAVANGVVKVGDPVFRNITKTGDLTWTGEVSVLSNNRMSWTNVTFTLSADGQTCQLSGGIRQTMNRRE